MKRINLYPSPLTPLTNDGKGDVTHGDYDVAIDNLDAALMPSRLTFKTAGIKPAQM